MSTPILENLRRDIEAAQQTDRRMTVAWVLLPVMEFVLIIAEVLVSLSTVISSFAGYASQYGSLAAPPEALGPPSAAIFVGAICFTVVTAIAFQLAIMYFFYRLIKRRNLHFLREGRFLSDLLPLLRAAAARRGTNIDSLVVSIENSSREMGYEEKEKSAVLWAALLIVPIINTIAFFYILYFLPRDYLKHERREDAILMDAQRALELLGVQFVYHRNDQIPSRSFALYLIASIITFGIFELYWEYTLIKDPNNHFRNHGVFEPALLRSLAPLVGQ